MEVAFSMTWLLVSTSPEADRSMPVPAASPSASCTLTSTMAALRRVAMAVASADGAGTAGAALLPFGEVPLFGVPPDGDEGALGTKDGAGAEAAARDAADLLAELPMAAPTPNEARTAMTMAIATAARRRPADQAPGPAAAPPGGRHGPPPT